MAKICPLVNKPTRLTRPKPHGPKVGLKSGGYCTWKVDDNRLTFYVIQVLMVLLLGGSLLKEKILQIA